MKQPRGIRNNNPGNIEWGDPWQGLRAEKTDARFAQFQTPAFGIRALARTLITYQDKHGIRTVSAAINRWAPPSENDTGAYVHQVQKAVGGEHVDMHDYQYLRPMVEAIIRHENGRGPVANANTWYRDDVIEEGLRLAGVRKPDASAGPVPVTTETVGATVAGVSGVGTLAEVLPAVATALQHSEDHLTSGEVLRVAFGVLLVTVAVTVAWKQVRRQQAGTL